MRGSQETINIDGLDCKIGAHGFVYRKDGDEWIKSSITPADLVKMKRDQEVREFKAEIARERDAVRIAKRDADRRRVLRQTRLAS